jgi:hypothetical protein
MQPVVDSIHELFVGVEALGTQPDHLGEEMVIAWCQVESYSSLHCYWATFFLIFLFLIPFPIFTSLLSPFHHS